MANTTLPTAPGALPLLGHVIPLMHDPLAFLASLPAYGELVRIRLGPTVAVVVCDPELTHRVLHDDRTYDRGGVVVDKAREMLGQDSIVTCSHSAHRPLRRMVQPAFHRDHLPGYAQVMAAHIQAITGGWRDGQIIDVSAEMMAITNRTALETMFSDALAPHVIQQTTDDFAAMFEGAYLRAILPPWLNRLPTPGNRRYLSARTRLRKTIAGVVNDRRASSADHSDLLTVMLPAREPAESGAPQSRLQMSDSEINAQVMTFVVGGVETTAAALSWALHLLGEHRDVQQRLQAEVDTVLAGSPARFDDLPRLTFTGSVFSEALRLYPPVWLTTRTVTTDTHLGGYPLAAGTTVVCSPYIIHHRSDLYDNPERFDPDRWNTTHRPASLSHGFIPFVTGARKCIGDSFATTEATLALATILARWQLEPLPGPPIRHAAPIILRPRNLRMRVVARVTAQPATNPPPRVW